MAVRWWRGCRVLLAGLILLLVLFPIMEDSASPIILIVVVAITFFLGVAATKPGSRRVQMAALLALVQIILAGLTAALNEHWSIYPFTVDFVLATTAILIVYCIYCVLRYVLQSNRITYDQIYAGICGYLMLGFAFGCVYYLLHLIQPTAFAVHNPALWRGRSPDLMYFSFVTLATLGYGDITPSSRGARAAAELEALAGMLYIAVFMARLVSLHSPGAGQRSGKRRDLAS